MRAPVRTLRGSQLAPNAADRPSRNPKSSRQAPPKDLDLGGSQGRNSWPSTPLCKPGQLGVQESRAEEITAFLRPNPDLTVAFDQIDLFTSHPYRPLGQALTFVASSYLVERRHKRELRLESAKEGTAIAVSQLGDQERNLLFNVRTAFVQVLQQKAVLAVMRENLGFYDRVLDVSRDRFKAGDIA